MPSYRGIVLDSIHPKVKHALDVETSGFERIDNESYTHITTRTPWMRSVPFIVPEDPDNAQVPKWQDWVLYSTQGKDRINSNTIPTYGRAGLGSADSGLYREDLRNTPVAHITKIDISNKGDLGTIRRATLGIRCYHEHDLQNLEMMYMVPGSNILLEWGWYSEVKSVNPIFLGDLYDGGSIKNSTDIQQAIIKKTLDIESLLVEYEVDSTNSSAGLYDGVLGVVTKFNWSNNTDGSFDITIDIIAPNSLTLGIPTDTYHLGGSIVDQESGDQSPINDVEVIYYRINTKSSTIATQQRKDYIKRNIENTKTDTVIKNTTTSDGVTMQASPEGLLTITYNDAAAAQGYVEFYKEGNTLKARIVDQDPDNIILQANSADEAELGVQGYQILDGSGKQIYDSRNRSGNGGNDLQRLQRIIDAAYVEHAESLASTIDQKQASEIEVAGNIVYTLGDGVEYLSWGDVRFPLYGNKYNIPVMTCSPGIGTIVNREQEISFDTETTPDNEMGITVYGEMYVSWRFIEENIINELFMPRKADDSLETKFLSLIPQTIESSDDTVLYESVKIINNTWIRSLDPKVCILPGQELSVDEDGNSTNLPGSEPLRDIKNKFYTGTDTPNYTEGYLRNILVNMHVVREAAKSSTSVNDFALEILSQVSEACGNVWSFKIITNSMLQQVMVVDENYSGNYKGYKDAEDQGDSVYKFSGIGVNNICRDVKIQTKLPNEIQALAYYAMSGAESSTATDINMFKLYGVGLQDRFNPKYKKRDTRVSQYNNERKQTWDSYAGLLLKTRTDINIGREKSNAYREGMTAALNFAKIFIFDGSDNNPTYSPPIPIDISITLNGVSGIYMGNAIMLDTVSEGGLLPDRYKGIVALQATSVDQSISNDGWTTSISTLMRPVNYLPAPIVPERQPDPDPIQELVTTTVEDSTKEQVSSEMQKYSKYLTYTGVPYINGVALPQQMFYKIRGSQSNGLFITQGNSEEYFSELIFEPWIALTTEASAAGILLQVNDVFRSYEKQEYLYNGRRDYVARGKTPPKFNPADRPGRSKHQSGVAIDINTNPHNHYKWMVNNAHRFGFKRNVKRESWHWVYEPNQDIYAQVPAGHESWRG